MTRKELRLSTGPARTLCHIHTAPRSRQASLPRLLVSSSPPLVLSRLPPRAMDAETRELVQRLQKSSASLVLNLDQLDDAKTVLIAANLPVRTRALSLSLAPSDPLTRCDIFEKSPLLTLLRV
jgi:hypothetical protein